MVFPVPAESAKRLAKGSTIFGAFPKPESFFRVRLRRKKAQKFFPLARVNAGKGQGEGRFSSRKDSWPKTLLELLVSAMKKKLTPYRSTTAALFCFLFAVGCSHKAADVPATKVAESVKPTSATAFSIAVIDLDRVADGIGAVDKMRVALQQFEQKTVADLQQSCATLFGESVPAGSNFAEFDKSAAPLIDRLSAEQQKEFAKHLRMAQNQLLARQKQVRDDFLNEVRPYAFQIARDQGCQLVLTTDQVYVATEQVDITDEVVRRISAINAAAATGNSSAATTASPPAKLASGGSFPIR